MTALPKLILFVAASAAATFFVLSCQHADPGRENPGKGTLALFQGPVRNVFEHRCIHCHHTQNPSGGLDLQDRRTVFDSSAAEFFISPGRPEESRIWTAISRPDTHPRVMPGDGWGLNPDERAAFREWILRGAPWPEGPEGRLEVKELQVQLPDYL